MRIRLEVASVAALIALAPLAACTPFGATDAGGELLDSGSSSEQASSDTDIDAAIVEEPEEQFEFNDEYAALLSPGMRAFHIIPGPAGSPYDVSIEKSPYGWSGVPEGIHDYSVNSVEEDRYGEYLRVKVSLRDEYIDAIPLEYLDIEESWDGNKMVANTSTRAIEDMPEEEVREALRFFTDFVLNETLDSIALDNPYRYEEWLDTVGDEKFSLRMLEKARDDFNPFVPEYNPCGEDDFWGYVCEVHGPPEGNFSDVTAAAPGLVHLSARNIDVEIEYEGELSYAAWSQTTVPMLRDGGSRNGVRHLYSLHMQERIGAKGKPQIYIFTRFHFRPIFDSAVTGWTNGDFDAHSKSGYLGYSLIKLDGQWKIHDFSSPYPQTGSWTGYTALCTDYQWDENGEPSCKDEWGSEADRFPEWANSSNEERPDLRYPEIIP